MAKLKEEKKKEILEYINDHTNKQDFFSISEPYLYQKFVDSEFTKEEITSILKELISDGRIFKDALSFRIYYLSTKYIDIQAKFKKYMKPAGYIYYIIGLYSLLLFSFYEPLYLWMKQSQFSLQEVFFFGALVGVICTYYFGILIYVLFVYIGDKVPLLMKYKPIFIIALLSSAIIIIYSKVTGQTIEIGHIIAIITTSVIGGLAYLNYTKK